MPYGTFKLKDEPSLVNCWSSYASQNSYPGSSVAALDIIFRDGTNRNGNSFKSPRPPPVLVPYVKEITYRIRTKRLKGESDAEYDRRRTVVIKKVKYRKVARKRTSRPKRFNLTVNDLTFTHQKLTVSSAAVHGTYFDTRLKKVVAERGMNGHIAVHNGGSVAFGYGYWRDQTPPRPTSYLHKMNYDLLMEADRQALAKIRGKIMDQKVDLATALGEGKETVSMLIELVARLAKILSLCRKGRLVEAAKLVFPTNTLTLANDYLMLTYGIKPLIDDIDGLMKHLADEIKEGVLIDVKAQAVRERDQIIPWSSDLPFKAKGTVVSRETYRAIYKCTYAIDSSLLRQWDMLGFNNPFAVAWELIPYSFVIDWLIPIGDWLKGINEFSGLTVSQFSRTHVYKHESGFRATVIPDVADKDGYKWTQSGEIAWHQDYIWIERKLLPAVIPKLPYPSWKGDPRLDVTLALLRQRI